MSAISNYVSSAYQSLPAIRLDTTSNMVRKATTLALPIIALVAASNAQMVDSGPVAYGACLAACSAATGGAFIPACIAACSPLLAAPTP